MKILFDHQIFSLANYGGVARYFYELSKGLKQSGHLPRQAIKYSENVFTNDKDLFKSTPFPVSFSFKGRTTVKEYFNKRLSVKEINKGDFDILHPTYYDSYCLKHLNPAKPLVVTFYDLMDERIVNRNASNPLIPDRQILAEKASKIIAISHSTKSDLVELYGVDEKKVQVIHLSGSLQATDLKKDASSGDYILFVGKRGGYKNFLPFLRALTPILKKEKTIRLICAGGGSFNSEEQATIKSLGVESSVVQQPIRDETLASLYLNALYFVFPSYYEGFGIPILEALSCSCPTILSNVSCLPEIGGDAALYFNPHNEEDMHDKMEKLLYDTLLQQHLREKGLARVREFSWGKMTDETIGLYQSLL